MNKLQEAQDLLYRAAKFFISVEGCFYTDFSNNYTFYPDYEDEPIVRLGFNCNDFMVPAADVEIITTENFYLLEKIVHDLFKKEDGWDWTFYYEVVPHVQIYEIFCMISRQSFPMNDSEFRSYPERLKKYLQENIKIV